MTARTERCRHNKTWLIAGGNIEWCYVCGAYRNMKRCAMTEFGVTNAVCPASKWTRPSGDPTKPPELAVWLNK